MPLGITERDEREGRGDHEEDEGIVGGMDEEDEEVNTLKLFF